MFFGSSKRKNTKAARIRKLKSRINKKEKKRAQDAELKKLQNRWAQLSK